MGDSPLCFREVNRPVGARCPVHSRAAVFWVLGAGARTKSRVTRPLSHLREQSYAWVLASVTNTIQEVVAALGTLWSVPCTLTRSRSCRR